jgi:tetratricopeptide (TPR) repeat protein
VTEISSQDTNKNAQISSFNLSSKTKEQWLQEGINHYNNERYEEALAAYDQAISLDPNCVTYYNKKGEALLLILVVFIPGHPYSLI